MHIFQRNIHLLASEQLDDLRDTPPHSSQLPQVQAEHYFAASATFLGQYYFLTPSSPSQSPLKWEALSSSSLVSLSGETDEPVKMHF